MVKNNQILYSFSECKGETITLTTGKWKLELWGAAATSTSFGGYSSGVLDVKKILQINIHLGSNNECNGGGTGTVKGGGASDLRAFGDTIYHRFLVAGGAGASGGNAAGGGYEGVGLVSAGRGLPGLHDGPGLKCIDEDHHCFPGSFGYGGNASGVVGGGGGGGWFGGASGSQDGSSWFAGGGGSGYALNATSFKPKDYQLNYTTEVFLRKINMIQGNKPMPDPENPSASLSTGNKKNGFARFTLISSMCTCNRQFSPRSRIQLVSILIITIS